VAGQTIVEYTQNGPAEQVAAVWETITSALKTPK
jgi:hypothetical protein